MVAPFDRAVLGAAFIGVPAALASALLVPWTHVYLVWAVPLTGGLFGAALALCGAWPFPWLESKLPYDRE